MLKQLLLGRMPSVFLDGEESKMSVPLAPLPEFMDEEEEEKEEKEEEEMKEEKEEKEKKEKKEKEEKKEKKKEKEGSGEMTPSKALEEIRKKVTPPLPPPPKATATAAAPPAAAPSAVAPATTPSGSSTTTPFQAPSSPTTSSALMQRSLQDMFGSLLLRKNSNGEVIPMPTDDVLYGVEVIGVFFGGSWQQHSLDFTPVLSSWYSAARLAGVPLEIVYVS